MTADITLRGPGDVVAILPYQLGYHPHDSVVVISLKGKRVGLVARADLPPERFVGDVVASLMGPLVRDGATSVILVGYEDVPDASQPLLLDLVEQLEQARIDVVDVAVVREGRRYSPICSEPCCPPDGVELPDPADVPGVAEYVALGRSPLRSRSDVEGLVAPEPWRCLGVARAVASRARMPRRRRRSVAAWSVLLDRSEKGRRPLDRAVVADLALGLADIPWRDGLIAWLVPSVLPTDKIDRTVLALLGSALPTWGGMGPGAAQPFGLRLAPEGVRPASQWGGPAGPAAGEAGDDSAGRGGAARRQAEREPLSVEREDLLHRLLALCRSVPDECPDLAAAVCTVAAHVAWVGGDGAIARAAVERALRLAPEYRLAQLLVQLVDIGLRLPSVTAQADRSGTLGEAG
ncbi:MAG: DUF4192 domain-containing protein [Ornithinibacter sp.]